MMSKQGITKVRFIKVLMQEKDYGISLKYIEWHRSHYNKMSSYFTIGGFLNGKNVTFFVHYWYEMNFRV